jgi:hypothetical protein
MIQISRIGKARIFKIDDPGNRAAVVTLIDERDPTGEAGIHLRTVEECSVILAAVTEARDFLEQVTPQVPYRGIEGTPDIVARDVATDIKTVAPIDWTETAVAALKQAAAELKGCPDCPHPIAVHSDAGCQVRLKGQYCPCKTGGIGNDEWDTALCRSLSEEIDPETVAPLALPEDPEGQVYF